jgi:hypothetical protein
MYCLRVSDPPPSPGASKTFLVRTWSLEKVQIWLKHNRNIGHFTCRPKYVYVVDSDHTHKKTRTALLPRLAATLRVKATPIP